MNIQLIFQLSWMLLIIIGLIYNHQKPNQKLEIILLALIITFIINFVILLTIPEALNSNKIENNTTNKEISVKTLNEYAISPSDIEYIPTSEKAKIIQSCKTVNKKSKLYFIYGNVTNCKYKVYIKSEK